jgi:F-type H+-transporting ATPase subunit a
MDILKPVLPPISIKAEPIITIGGYTITNSMIFSLIVVIAITIFFIFATRKMNLVPSRLQNMGEFLVEFLLGVSEGAAGRRVGRRIFPLIASIFLFVIVANWSGLLPGVGTVGGCYPAHEVALQEEPTGGLPTPSDLTFGGCPHGTEFRPFLRAANADLNMTLAMALLAVGVVQVAGIAAHGFGGYMKELLTPIAMAPLHIVGELARVISLSFRLFGNIFGGEVLVTVMYVLLGSLLLGFGTFIFLGLELLFGFIQALLFAILTLVYITTAVAGHGGSHEEQAHAEAGTAEAAGIELAGKLGGMGGQIEQPSQSERPRSEH